MSKRARSYIEQWSEGEITAMLSNPIYTGIIADRTLLTDHPHDRARFIEIALATAKQYGLEQMLRQFLKDLKHATYWTLLVPVHDTYLIDRHAIITEEQFIRAGCAQCQNRGIEKYFNTVLDNLQQGNLFLA